MTGNICSSGYKKTNQDRCTAFSYLDGDPDLGFFAVYDGHGGTGVANYLKDHLHEFILSQEEYKEGDLPEAILKSFLAVDSELKTYGNATELTGSTGLSICDNDTMTMAILTQPPVPTTQHINVT